MRVRRDEKNERRKRREGFIVATTLDAQKTNYYL
jgi:hypothetical protein